MNFKHIISLKLILIIALLPLFLLLSLSILFLTHFYPVGFSHFATIEAWGQTGDFFGGVLNPLLAYFSFLGVLVTVILNQKAIAHSNEEVRLSRDEMSRSTRALYEQNRQIQLQRLETTFFELLRHLSLITADIYLDEQKLKEREIDLPISPHIYKGKLALQKILSLFTTYRELHSEKNIQIVAKEFFFKIEDLVDFYFDTISIILRFLNNGNLDEHLFYRDLLSAQMSTDELLLLFYYTLPHPESELSRNIKESKILKILNINDLINKEEDSDYLKRYA